MMTFYFYIFVVQSFTNDANYLRDLEMSVVMNHDKLSARVVSVDWVTAFYKCKNIYVTVWAILFF